MNKNPFVEVEIADGECAEFPLDFFYKEDPNKIHLVWCHVKKKWIHAHVIDKCYVIVPMGEMTPYECYRCYIEAQEWLEVYEPSDKDYLINPRRWNENGFAMLTLTLKAK